MLTERPWKRPSPHRFADRRSSEHRQWLAEPGKRNPHREKPQRTIRHEWISDFHKRSERLEDPTSDVASSNDDWLLGMAAEFRTSFRPATGFL
jgi:hypothetical protein